MSIQKLDAVRTNLRNRSLIIVLLIPGQSGLAETQELRSHIRGIGIYMIAGALA